VNLEGVLLLPMQRAHIPAVRWDMAEEERQLLVNLPGMLQGMRRQS